LVAAQNFARAARVAREANVDLSLRSRRIRRRKKADWRTDVDLTRIEPALTKYVERRTVSEVTTTQLVGRLISLDHDPPGFVLETGRGKLRVSMRASLREKAWQLWGLEVVVVAEAKIAPDGRLSEPRAAEILPGAALASEEDEEAAFGLLKPTSDQAREYFDTLRQRN
jgi:hypothetical protein